MQRRQIGQEPKPFLSPGDVARELAISSSTVMRLIHSGRLPAIAVSERIYRIPVASFELFMAGAVERPGLAPLGPLTRRPNLGEGEALPSARRGVPTAT